MSAVRPLMIAALFAFTSLAAMPIATAQGYPVDCITVGEMPEVDDGCVEDGLVSLLDGGVTIPFPSGTIDGGSDGCWLDDAAPIPDPTGGEFMDIPQVQPGSEGPCTEDYAQITIEGDAIHIHFLAPQAIPTGVTHATAGQHSLFSDGTSLTIRDLYISGASDLDGDGDKDGVELFSCLSNPFNPDANCQDADGDGLEFYTFGSNAAACSAAGGFYASGECTVDEETDCAGHGPGQVCDPNDWDSDNDLTRDSSDAFPNDATNGDPDQDGLNFAQEAACGTNGNKYDTDGDSLSEGPTGRTSSGGVSAGTGANECAPGGTDGTTADTDGDGQNEGNGGDPRPTDATRRDIDRDGLLDSEETSATMDSGASGVHAGYATPNVFRYCTNHPADGPSQRKDGADGPDAGTAADTCTAPASGVEGATDPNDADSDNDGLTDGMEVIGMVYTDKCTVSKDGTRSDPHNVDTDADGTTDDAEDCNDPLGAPFTGNPEDPASEPAFSAPFDLVGALASADPCVIAPQSCEDPSTDPCDYGPVPVYCVPGPDVCEFDVPGVCGPLPLPSTPFDLQDPWDVDGDGKRSEANGQLDLVEQRVAYLDADDTGKTSSFEKNKDLEGSGQTLVVLTPAATGTPKPLARVHIGDVKGNGASESLVVHANGGYTCVYSSQGQVRVAIAGASFNPLLADPCGPNFSAVATLDANGVSVLHDANRDQVPESYSVKDLESSSCAAAPGPTGLPNPASCPWTAPQPLGLPTDDPCEVAEIPGLCSELPAPEDLIASLCAEDSPLFGSMACGGEAPCDPSTGDPEPCALFVICTLDPSFCAPPPPPCDDEDIDGVCDADDDCPGTETGVDVDDSGCPLPPPEPTEPCTLADILAANDSCEPDPEALVEEVLATVEGLTGEVVGTLPACEGNRPPEGSVACVGGPAYLREYFEAVGLPWPGLVVDVGGLLLTI